MRNKILLIDEDKDILDILTEWFTEEGFDVKAFSEVNDVFELIKIHQPNLVLLDYILNGINGGELCHQIKKVYHTLPVIILSAYPKVMLSLGTYYCDLFIPKPFDLFSLAGQINALIKKNHPVNYMQKLA